MILRINKRRMNLDTSNIILSDIDETRFGIKTAKSFPETTRDILNIMNFCDMNHVKLLIARCSTSNIQVVHEMERHGFFMMDTLVYYSFKLKKKPVPEDVSDIEARPVRQGEEVLVKDIARSSFQGYQGHYHADNRLDRQTCDDVYTDWAYISCFRNGMADEVMVAESEESLAGFATLRKNDSSEGEGVLFGVAPSFQGKGIYRSLMISGMKWCVSEKLDTMIVSTQITNTAVQKVWTRLGFEPGHSYYTFHKWFD